MGIARKSMGQYMVDKGYISPENYAQAQELQKQSRSPLEKIIIDNNWADERDVYESLAHGFYYPSTPQQRELVMSTNLREGKSYWQIDTLTDLEAKWPKILAAKPDLIKIILTDSEHYTADSHLHPQLGKGLDPALAAPIVERAHAAGLKVAAHIDTAADFHVA